MKHILSLLSELYTTYVEAIRLIAKHWKKFLPIILIPATLSFILTISTRLALGNAFANMSSIASLFSLSNINSFVALLLIGCSMLIQLLGVIVIIYLTTHHEEATVFHAFEESITFIWRFVFAAVSIFIISLLSYIVGYIPVWLIGLGIALISESALTQALPWLEIIANIISALSAMFFVFAPYIMVEKNLSTMQALRESLILVRMHFIKTVAGTGVITLISTLLTITLLYIPRIGSTLSILVITPFSTIYLYVLYTHILQSKQLTTMTEPATPSSEPLSTSIDSEKVSM